MRMHDLRRIAEAYESMTRRIVPTEKWISEKYDIFNSEIFGNKLPKIEFGIIDANNSENAYSCGTCDYSYDDETKRFSDFKISITNKFNIDERIYEDILLHEMIHLENMVSFPEELLKNGEPSDDIQHLTRCFKSEVARINEEFGRNITENTDARDKTVYKLSDDCRNMYMKLKKDVVFVFAICSSDFIVYGRSDEERFETLADGFRKHFNNPRIEIVRPSNVYVGEKILNNSHRYESGIFNSIEDFENFKDELLAPITESDNSEELPPMPKWAERAKNRGCNVIFDGGKWKMRIS